MQFISLGVLLGLSAGITPGPLLALVFSESLQHGTSAGIKVAVAPIISDTPIFLLALYVLGRLSHINPLLGAISILGGGLLLILGIQNFKVRGVALNPTNHAPRPFIKGIMANALNPHPYLFWMTVGASIAHRALERHPIHLAAFLGCFYASFVAAKIVLAVLVGRSRKLLNDTTYRYIMWIMGAALCLLSLFFFRDGLRLIAGNL
jgi:threonine/homoserine/homoserine lactone efflux protein